MNSHSQCKNDKKDNNEEEEDIIINDEFSDDNDTIVMNTIPISKDKEKVIEDLPQLRIDNENENDNIIQPQPQQIHHKIQQQPIDYRDINIELPSSSKLIYQVKELSLEEEYINKIKMLTKENNELKQSSSKLEKEIKVINEEIKADNDSIENHNKKLKSDSALKLQPIIKEYEIIKEKTSKLEEDNKRLLRQVNNYKAEYDKLQSDLKLKSQKVDELNQRITQIESELEKNKALFTKDKDNSDKKENEEDNETIEECNRVLVNTENELSIAIDKLHQLTNENYKLKQMMNKNRLSTPVIYNKPQINIDKGIESHYYTNTNTTIKTNTYANTTTNSTSIAHSKSNSALRGYQIQQSPNKKKQSQSDFYNSTYGNAYNTHTPSSTTTVNSNHNPFETATKESKILEIETTLFKLQKERDKLSEELTRLPEYPKHKNVINKKRNLEISINDFNTKIEKNKQKITEIKTNAQSNYD